MGALENTRGCVLFEFSPLRLPESDLHISLRIGDIEVQTVRRHRRARGQDQTTPSPRVGLRGARHRRRDVCALRR